MTDYLKFDDPGATEGMEKKEPKAGGQFLASDAETVECPVCHGYGGWHLRLNAYGVGKHFDCFCAQCNGWGYVEAGSKDATCVHERKELNQQQCRDLGISHFGMCWHVEKCTKCGAISSYDSSG